MGCLWVPDQATDFLILILYIFSVLPLGSECLEVENVDRYDALCVTQCHDSSASRNETAPGYRSVSYNVLFI